MKLITRFLLSNKQVPAVYRTIINQVIESVRPDFDDVGVEEAVLQELLRSWEAKVAVSRVADFSSDLRMGPLAKQFPMLINDPVTTTVVTAAAAGTKGGKTAKGDSPAVTATTTTTTGSTPVAGGSKSNGKKAESAVELSTSTNATATTTEKKEGEENDDEINSDLDDPEEEVDADDDEAGADSGDLVIALYEKVQRVKNKWKVTLKDGLISVGGKEYLFAKCSGEFEW